MGFRSTSFPRSLSTAILVVEIDKTYSLIYLRGIVCVAGGHMTSHTRLFLPTTREVEERDT